MIDQGTVPRASEFARVARRRRRQPVEAEREILRAATEMIGSSETNVPITVAALMARTGLGRSAFYAYFRDLPDLLRRLLHEIEGELSATSSAWFDGNGDPAEDCRRSAQTLVDVYQRHGLILSAIADAAAADPDLAARYQQATVDGFAAAVAERVDRERNRGTVPGDQHPQSPRALMAMTDTYLRETLGRHPRADPAVVVRTLTLVWSQALYGRTPADPAEPPTRTATPDNSGPAAPDDVPAARDGRIEAARPVGAGLIPRRRNS